MRALIAEDEPVARKRLSRMLKEHGIAVMAEVGCGDEAVELLRRKTVDVAFLDVEMPGRDGLSVVREVGPGALPHIVFVTAHEGYAIEAFNVHAVDYLLKPFNEDRLADTLAHVERLMERVGSGEAVPWREGLESLLKELEAGAAVDTIRYAERLLLKVESSLRFVRVRDIEYVEAEGNCVRVRIGKKEHTVRRQIGDLEAQLDPRQFCRVHRSAIVNLDAVAHLEPWFSGGYLVQMRCGKELKLSRGYASRLFQRIGETL